MRAGLAHADRQLAKRSTTPENIAGGLAGEKSRAKSEAQLVLRSSRHAHFILRQPGQASLLVYLELRNSPASAAALCLAS